MLENLSVPTQLIGLAAVLVLLFILVRLNHRYNKKKLLKRQEHNFEARLKKREEKEKKTERK